MIDPFLIIRRMKFLGMLHIVSLWIFWAFEELTSPNEHWHTRPHISVDFHFISHFNTEAVRKAFFLQFL
jgi:hypothetical protein